MHEHAVAVAIVAAVALCSSHIRLSCLALFFFFHFSFSLEKYTVEKDAEGCRNVVAFEPDKEKFRFFVFKEHEKRIKI